MIDLKEIGSKVVRKIDLKPGLQRIREHLAKMPRVVPKPYIKPVMTGTPPIQMRMPQVLPVLKQAPKIEAKPYFNPKHPTLK